MRHTELQPSRVAQVFGCLSPDRYTFGTGYRISDRLVLTAAHVLDGVPPDAVPDCPPPFQVRLDGADELQRVTCVWREQGLALLRLDQPPPGRISPVRLGRVDGTRATTVSAQALGYPKHVAVDDPGGPLRGRAQVPCRIHTAATGRPGHLRAQLDSTPAGVEPGDSPWKGMSGAAVVTSQSHLLVGVFEEQTRGAGVSAHEITAVAGITDRRWRKLLSDEGISPDPRPVFPDRWNETCRHLIPHGDHVDDLAAGGSFLSEDRLPFVDPGDHPSAPGKVLDVLAEMAEGAHPRIGLMLSGISGIGKTRLCLETAARADRDGWYVVHLRQRAPLEDVWASIRQLPARVLLVVEDIGQLADTSMKAIDDQRVRSRNEGVKLAVLTCARTEALRYANSWKLLPGQTFEEVEVRSDQRHHAAISRQAVRSLARDAVQQEGEPHLVRVCGGLPAIAVMLADYWNGEAGAGRDVSSAVPLDAQGIAGWLREVLDRNELRLPPVRPSEPDPQPDGRLVAAAWIAAVVPRHADRLAADLAARGRIRSPSGAEWEPGNLIDSLCRAGILARRGATVRAVHDLYVDQLLGEVLVDRDSGTIRRKPLRKTLKAGLSDHQALRNVARSVNRLREALDGEPGSALAAAVEEWCEDRATELTAHLGEDPDGQTLHTLLGLSTWQRVTRRLVAPVAEDWLRRHFSDRQARDGVLAVASCLSPQVGYAYLIGWIADNATDPRAAYAFHRFSPPDDLDPAFGEWTVEHALEWLTHHGMQPGASFVLRRLLETGEGLGLPHGHPLAARVVAWARAWLRRNGATHHAGFVARPLVQRPELRGAKLAAVAQLLLDVVAHREPRQASFALEAVFRRHRRHKDLPDAVYKQVVRDSLRWLDDSRGYGRRPEAVYVLENLIAPDLPGRNDRTDAVRLALRWLRGNGDLPSAGRLLKRLLHLARKETDPWARLTEDESAELARYTLSWLSLPESARINRPSVLGALLRTRLIDDSEELRRCADEALTLCRQAPRPTMARDLLPPLLAKSWLLADLRTALMEVTFDHVARHPRSEHTSYPLTSLLLRNDLSTEEYAAALAATLEWLDEHPHQDSAIPLLTSALRNHRADQDDRCKLADRAVKILSRRMLDRPPGRDLVKRLMELRGEIPLEWNRFVARACDEFAAADMPTHAGKSLRVMVMGADRLDGPVREHLHASCLAWCAAHFHSSWALQLLPLVLDSRDLSPPMRRRVSEAGCELLDARTASRPDSGQLLVALLRSGDLAATEVDRLVGVAFDWLTVQVGNGHAATITRLVAHRLRQNTSGGRARTDAEQRGDGPLDAWLYRNPQAPPEQRAAAEALRHSFDETSP